MLNNYRQTFYAPFTCKTVYQRMKYVYSNESDLNFIGGKLILMFLSQLKKDGNLHGFQKSIQF